MDGSVPPLVADAALSSLRAMQPATHKQARAALALALARPVVAAVGRSDDSAAKAAVPAKILAECASTESVTPKMVTHVATWLAGTGRYEMRKATRTTSALQAVAQIIRPMLAEELVASLIKRAQEVGPMSESSATLSFSRAFLVPPNLRPILLGDLGEILRLAKATAIAKLEETDVAGAFCATLPERPVGGTNHAHVQQWILTVELKLAHPDGEAVANAALDAAVAVLTPLVVNVPLEGTMPIRHLVGRGGARIRALSAWINTVMDPANGDECHLPLARRLLNDEAGSITSIEWLTRHSVDISQQRLVITALVLPTGTTTMPADQMLRGDVAASIRRALRCVVCNWLSNTMQFISNCIDAHTSTHSEPEERWAFEAQIVAKENGEAKRDRDMRHGARNTRRLQAKAHRVAASSKSMVAARGTRRGAVGTGRLTVGATKKRPTNGWMREPLSACRPSQEWALEEIEQSAMVFWA